MTNNEKEKIILTPSEELANKIARFNTLETKSLTGDDAITNEELKEKAEVYAETLELLENENLEIRQIEYKNALNSDKPLVNLIKKGVVPQMYLKNTAKKDDNFIKYEVNATIKHINMPEFINYAKDVADVRVVEADCWKNELKLFAIYLSKYVKNEVGSIDEVIVPDGLKSIQFEGVTENSKISLTTLGKMLTKVINSVLGKDAENLKVTNQDIKFLVSTVYKSNKKKQAYIVMPKENTIISGLVSVMYKLLNNRYYEIGTGK